MKSRVYQPALTPTEIDEATDAYRHATQQGIKLAARHRVKVVLRCNQLTPSYGVCDWTQRIEVVAVDATYKAKLTIAQHLEMGHPYLDLAAMQRVLDATWVNVRDIGG